MRRRFAAGSMAPQGNASSSPSRSISSAVRCAHKSTLRPPEIRVSANYLGDAIDARFSIGSPTRCAAQRLRRPRASAASTPSAVTSCARASIAD